MPVCCAHATPPKLHGSPAEHVRARPRHVDPRRDLHRALLAPAPLGPVRRDLVEARDLHVDHPLARRDVAVEPRHDRPHREAVLDRQRDAVHRDREHRVAVVGERGQRRPAGPAVVGGLQHGVRARLRPGLRQQVGEPDAAPPGVADQVAADRVGHAVEGDPGLGDLPVHQVGVGQRDLPVDHAVDPQRPVLRLDGGYDDRGVDPVEARRCRSARATRPSSPIRAAAGTRGSVTSGSRSSRRDSSTWRRPRPTTRPAAPSTTAPAAIIPARITNARRVWSPEGARARGRPSSCRSRHVLARRAPAVAAAR